VDNGIGLPVVFCDYLRADDGERGYPTGGSGAGARDGTIKLLPVVRASRVGPGAGARQSALSAS
jgi:hypothetical protein